MRGRRVTVARMEPDLLVDVLDVIDAQGGDWEAVDAVLRDRYSDDIDVLAEALDTYAAVLLLVYEEPGGPGFLRAMADHHRRPVPAAAGRRWFSR